MVDCGTRETLQVRTRYCRCYDHRAGSATFGTEIHEPYGEKSRSSLDPTTGLTPTGLTPGDPDFNFKCQPCEGEKIKVFEISNQTKWFIF